MASSPRFIRSNMVRSQSVSHAAERSLQSGSPSRIRSLSMVAGSDTTLQTDGEMAEVPENIPPRKVKLEKGGLEERMLFSKALSYALTAAANPEEVAVVSAAGSPRSKVHSRGKSNFSWHGKGEGGGDAADQLTSRESSAGTVKFRGISAVPSEQVVVASGTASPPEVLRSRPESGAYTATIASTSAGGDYAGDYKAYMPGLFQDIRKSFSIDENAYTTMLSGRSDDIPFESNSKSGSFMFHSRCRKFIIKTITRDESHALCEFLPAYYEHIKANRDTLLCQFLGIYRVKFKLIREKGHRGLGRMERFVVMGTVDNGEAKHEALKFDLKGSLYKRFAKPDEIGSHKPLKDQDVLACKFKLKMGAHKDAFLGTLHRDVNFLASLGVMDYSFLIIITTEVDYVSKLTQTSGSTAGAAKLSRKKKLLGRFTSKSGPRTVNTASSGVDELSPVSASDVTVQMDVHSAKSSTESIVNANPSSNPNPKARVPWRRTRNWGGSFITDETVVPQERYHLGIIDWLQLYTPKKRLENVYLGLKGNNRNLVSCVHPTLYADRFLEFMERLTDGVTASVTESVPDTSNASIPTV